MIINKRKRRVYQMLFSYNKDDVLLALEIIKRKKYWFWRWRWDEVYIFHKVGSANIRISPLKDGNKHLQTVYFVQQGGSSIRAYAPTKREALILHLKRKDI